MRLPESIGKPRDDEAMSAEVARELEALDRALAGEHVDPDLEGLAQLVHELRAERPGPSQDFNAKLDHLAEAGFPPEYGHRLDRTARRLSDGIGWIRAQRPRRLIPALGAAATFVIVAGVAISQIDTDGGGEPGGIVSPAQRDEGRNEGGGAQALEEMALEARGSGAKALKPDAAREERRGGTALTPLGAGRAGFEDNLGRTARDAEFRFRQRRAPAAGRLDDASGFARPRKIAQQVAIGLASDPADFRDTANDVLGVVDDHRGFVLQSRVTGGDPDVRGAEPGRAVFQVKIPALQLQPAISALSDLGHVVSRSDAQRDITARFVSAKKRIAALTESRERLLRKLEEAFTITEQDAIKRQLRIVESQLENARDDLAAAQQRVRLVPVTITVTADSAVSDDDEGAWGIGDAFDDAKRVLTVVAGAALVTAAALLPFTLLGLLVWLAWRGYVRREREKALDEAPGTA